MMDALTGSDVIRITDQLQLNTADRYALRRHTTNDSLLYYSRLTSVFAATKRKQHVDIYCQKIANGAVIESSQCLPRYAAILARSWES